MTSAAPFITFATEGDEIDIIPTDSLIDRCGLSERKKDVKEILSFEARDKTQCSLIPLVKSIEHLKCFYELFGKELNQELIEEFGQEFAGKLGGL